MAECKKLKIFYFFLFLGGLFSCPYLLSASDEIKDATQKTPKREVASDVEINSMFREVTLALKNNDSTLFDKKVDELVSYLTEHDLKNAPQLSFALITLMKARDFDEPLRIKILRAVQKISPTHPEVMLSVSSYLHDLGLNESLSNFIHGAKLLSEYPVTLISIVSKILMILLVCIVASLLFTQLGNIFFSRGELLSYISSFFTKQRRHSLSLIFLSVILFLPVLLDLPYVLLMWSLITALACHHMRFYPILCGLVILALSVLFPVMREIQVFTDSSFPRIVEDLRMNNYVFEGREVILNAAKKSTNNALLNVLAGQEEYSAGRQDEAQQFYKIASTSFDSHRGLQYVLEFNMGHIAYSQGRVDEAYRTWKNMYDDGWREYELLYNLCIVTTANYDKVAFDRYYHDLKNSFPRVSMSFTLDIQPLVAKIPARTLMEYFISPVYLESLPFVYKNVQFEESILVSHSRKLLLMVCSSFTIIWGLFLLNSSRRTFRYRESIITERDLLRSKKYYIMEKIPCLSLFLRQKEVLFSCLCIPFLFSLTGLWMLPFIIKNATVDVAYVYSLMCAFIMIFNTYYYWKMKRPSYEF